MAKQTSATYKIAQWDIGESLRSHTVNYNDLNASLTIRGTKFPLFQFGLTRRRSEHVWIEELRGHPTPLAHGFPAIVDSGHAGTFQRVGRSRFPIREMVGLAALQMIGSALRTGFAGKTLPPVHVLHFLVKFQQRYQMRNRN
jgi:hypothetical protein